MIMSVAYELVLNYRIHRTAKSYNFVQDLFLQQSLASHSTAKRVHLGGLLFTYPGKGRARPHLVVRLFGV